MSAWFKLPVDCTLIVDDSGVAGSSDSIAIDGCVVLTDHHVEKVEIAINSYDSNQELIAKLQADIELLRDALKKISRGAHSRSSEALLISKVLIATK